jgi:acetolactate synthase-1/2/3 large subunit
MTGQELVTAVQEGLPVKVVLGDNGAYGTIAMHQHQRIGPDALFAVHLRSPDFAAVARAYGVAAFTVEKTAEFADAFVAALAHPGPALVHVKTSPSSRRPVRCRAERWREAGGRTGSPRPGSDR